MYPFGSYVASDGIFVSPSFIEAAKTLSRAWQAEHMDGDGILITVPWLRYVGFVLVNGMRPKNGINPDNAGMYDSWKWEDANVLTIGRGNLLELSRWEDRDEWWLSGRATPLSDPVEIMVPSLTTRGDVRRAITAFKIVPAIDRPRAANRKRGG